MSTPKITARREKTPLQLKREVQHLRKNLTVIVGVCTETLRLMDIEMAKPSTNERGQRIAKILNYLQLQKDLAKRFGLGILK